MPVSTSVHISHCLALILGLRPKSVLDVGCGFGLWGFLCREHLDAFEERVWPHTWQIRIDGIEYFEPYILDHQRALYNNIQIGDIRDLAPDVDEYDLIIAGDVIEHLEKDEALAVLDTLYSKARKALLVNIPIGGGWDHPEQHGNPAELHRSEWMPEDFARFPNAHRLFQINTLQYGVFICPKDGVEQLQWIVLDHRAAAAEARGDIEEAVNLQEKALALVPGNEDILLRLAMNLVQMNRPGVALRHLKNAIAANPRFHYGYYTAASVLNVMGKRDEAVQYLDTLLDQHDVEPELYASAKQLREEIAH